MHGYKSSDARCQGDSYLAYGEIELPIRCPGIHVVSLLGARKTLICFAPGSTLGAFGSVAAGVPLESNDAALNQSRFMYFNLCRTS